MKKHKMLKRIFLALCIFVVGCLAAFGIYLSNYHAGDADALAAMSSPSEGVHVVATDETIAFVPENSIKAGIVYYPGMKIRGEAYSVMADSLASDGYLCVLVNMPLNMSVLNPDVALTIVDEWPEVKDWYIGGHSMGGQVAQKCALNHPGTFKGVITVARQLDFDFSDSTIAVLGVYGSNDKICTLEEVAEDEVLTNNDCYTEVILDGGCHGYFGNYGFQRWDGEPTITREEQMQATVDAILEFLNAGH